MLETESHTRNTILLIQLVLGICSVVFYRWLVNAAPSSRY